MTDFLRLLNKLLEGKDLTEEESAFALQEIMKEKISSVQTSAFLTALKMKSETVEEITAFAKTMRKNALTFTPKVNNLIDTAGTGGDRKNTFNISTCSAFVAAGARANVAKHGNKAVSSKSGSSDVLQELGINLISESEVAEKQLEGIGISFLFAPYFHPAMKSVASVRKELRFKTVFNILGPLTNPANVKRQLIGVYDKLLLSKMAEALKNLKVERALLVSSDLDEISISNETIVYEISKSKIANYVISPEDFGFKRSNLENISVSDTTESAKIILNVLNGNTGHARDIVVLNAGAAIYVSGIVSSIEKGIALAEKSIDSGKALEKLNQMRDFNGHS